ncbi:MAG: HD domain-containing protein, partial [Polyangiaceae bacterium]|nr:HD domain-containing protein [Polyangiaceae bacterium]
MRSQPPPSVAPPSLVSEVRAYVARHRGALTALVDPGDPASGGEALGARHAKVFDGLLSSVHALAATRLHLGHALAAVGSYGRGAMALASDLDVRFLVDARDRDRAGELADGVLYPLWDGGLTIGHQVVEAEELIELARTDLPTATSLLDWRHLAGDGARSEALALRARSSLFGDAGIAAFVDRLELEVAARHLRFGGSVYLLEPDVRNGAGAMRDLDVIGWMARARWGVMTAAGLVRYGVIVQREAGELSAARELLWRVRNRLHLAAGRRADRLTFDQQERIAPELGYGEGGAAVEAFMSDYYRAARTVSQLRELVTRRARPVIGRRRPHEEAVGAGLVSFDQQLTFDSPERLRDDPAVALRLYAEAIARQRPVFAAARDAVTRAAQDPAWAADLSRSPEAARLFVELTTTAQETQFFRRSVLGELHDVGLLVAMIPEFSPVVGRVHHDVYHVYTVDVHSVAAVDRLRALARGDSELAAEYPLACRLAAEASRPRVLYMATLLHDVGKDIGGKGHAERGAELALHICPRLGLPEGETAAIAHLIRVHLAMYHLATRRDVDDPATVEELLRAAPDAEALRDLFLLTVADLSTTSPTALTVWKARLLDELYLAADKALGGGADAARSTVDARAAARAAAGARPG